MATRYTNEFRREVVRLHRDSGKSYRELASDLLDFDSDRAQAGRLTGVVRPGRA